MVNYREYFIKNRMASKKTAPMGARLLEWKIFEKVLSRILRGVMFMQTTQNDDGSIWAEKMTVGDRETRW